MKLRLPLKTRLLTLIALIGAFIANAQTGPATQKPQIPALNRQGVVAFRQYLKQQETARQQGVAQFLRRNANRLSNPIRQEFVDAKGAYHFLHHIDETGTPVYYQTRSNLGLATSIKTNKLWSGGGLGLNLQGQGMEVSKDRSRLGMWEPGALRTTHEEFGGRAITRDDPAFVEPSDNADHATHVAGTLIAAGVNPMARGMANQARLDCYEIQKNEFSEMEKAAQEGMLVSNHSYGPSYDKTRKKLGVYDEASQVYDQITATYPTYLQFHAAGNDRDDKKDITFDILIGGANAKNVATVGAVNRLDEAGYTGPASVKMADFSSYGPTDDGRIKPDFVTPGVGITSPYSAADDIYSTIDGTSMASPGAAGSLFLLQQHYTNTKDRFMRAATLKGLAIHTADEAGDAPGPDYRFGWGLLNLEKAIAVINKTGGLQVLEEATLLEHNTYQKRVTTTGGPFKATICWTDVPGTPVGSGKINDRTPLLVHDLDIRLINVATSQTLELPWKLDPDKPADPATRGDNTVDNVEQIFVENLPAGEYVVQVSHKGTLGDSDGEQGFSLFVTSTASEKNTAAFSVKGVTTQICETLSAGQRRLTFTPQYAGQTSEPVSFSVVNELNPTTNPGPYTLNLYTDNPRITLVAKQGSTTAQYTYEWLAACNSNQPPANTAPTVANPTGNQSAMVNQWYSFSIPASTFTDKETPNSLAISVSGLPAGLNFANGTISGSPSEAGQSTISVTATDPGGLMASTSFVLTVTGTPANNTTFGITGVTTVSCETLSAGQRRVKFTPQYAGQTQEPVSFSVVNELNPTTNPGPYTLNLYTDNPRITLVAKQGSTTAQYTYEWLAVCNGTNNPPPPASSFSITDVTTVSCKSVGSGQRQVSFTPQYAGQTQEPVSFSVVNELNPTTNPGPYTLNLYTDNPRITLVAKQGSTTARYTYEWLAACPSGARLGAEPTPDLSVTVLGNPVQQGQIPVEIRGAANQPLRLSLTDMTGQIIGSHYVEQANPLERHTFEIGRQQPGLLLLRVSTPTQLKTVKLLNH